MKDISQQCGLPISIAEEDGKLYSTSPELIIPREGKRTYDQLQDVTIEPIEEQQKEYAYLVYRNVFMRRDSGAFLSSQLRYNLIVMPPGVIGNEYLKTLGHFHSSKPGTLISYAEIYEIILGEAIFLIQKMDASFQTVTEHYIYTCKQGEKMIIPPGFGHTTINATQGTLVMGNIMTIDNDPNYEVFKRFKGASYRVLRGKEGNMIIEKNDHFGPMPPLKKITVKSLEHLNIPSSQPLYELLIKKSETFSFISNPDQFLNELDIGQLFIL
jgi:glucose-6-phosphate isomerase